MCALWEEIDGLNLLPTLTELTTEVNEFFRKKNVPISEGP